MGVGARQRGTKQAFAARRQFKCLWHFRAQIDLEVVDPLINKRAQPTGVDRPVRLKSVINKLLRTTAQPTNFHVNVGKMSELTREIRCAFLRAHSLRAQHALYDLQFDSLMEVCALAKQRVPARGPHVTFI
jgi:hypothetical protein